MSKFARSVILASLLSATAQANQPVPTPDSALPTAQPVPTLNSAPMVVPAAPEISAKAHILIDYYSGQVLAEQNLMCARNQELCGLDTELADGDEVAFFPTVTGG